MLISKDYLISEYIDAEEVPDILHQKNEQSIKLMPIILEPCAWKKIQWLSELQVLPKDGEPLSTMKEHSQDYVFENIAYEISDYFNY